MQKTCTKCGKTKDIEEFGWCNNAKGYRNYWCKQCFREYRRKYYLLHKEDENIKSKNYRRRAVQ